MKYIMAEAEIAGCVRKIPFVFPDALVHQLMSVACEPVLRLHGYGKITWVSAGELTVFGSGFLCDGGSETMGLMAAEGDAEVINMYDYLHGM